MQFEYENISYENIELFDDSFKYLLWCKHAPFIRSQLHAASNDAESE